MLVTFKTSKDAPGKTYPNFKDAPGKIYPTALQIIFVKRLWDMNPLQNYPQYLNSAFLSASSVWGPEQFYKGTN